MAKQNGPARSSQQQSPSRQGSQTQQGRQAGSSGSGGGGARNASSAGSQRRSAAASTSSPSRSRNRPQGGSRSGSRNRGGAGNGGSGGGGAQRQRAQASSQPSRGRAPGRGAIAGAGAKVVETVRENPIPAALVGAGLTWLIVKNRQRLPMPHVPQALTGIAETARESFSDSAQSTRQAVRGGVGSAAETLAEYAQSGAAKVGQVARKGYRRSREAVATTWDEHPLTVGLALLAAGVAAGMMLPAPKSGAISRAAKGLKQRVTSTGEELIEGARELVSSSARAISREAKRQGLTPGQLGRKVKRVAGAAAP
jgi:hypothetical protein